MAMFEGGWVAVGFKSLILMPRNCIIVGAGVQASAAPALQTGEDVDHSLQQPTRTLTYT
jgi:hypothetical protein